MNLDQLVDAAGFVRSAHGVPAWTLGCFRRRSITYFTGEEDAATQVIWLQSRGLTFDLRVNPRRRDLAEGGLAATRWDGGLMSWSDWISFQPHGRWPEPGKLTRVGDCLIEFAPSGAYVEDWRWRSRGEALLVGLRLVQERALRAGTLRPASGGLVVCGSDAGFVAGPGGEVSHATADRTGRFTVRLSTHEAREGRPLILDGFEPLDGHRVIQHLEQDGMALERTYLIDTLERGNLPHETAVESRGATWLERERAAILPADPAGVSSDSDR
jgi:hypothetical protein